VPKVMGTEVIQISFTYCFTAS